MKGLVLKETVELSWSVCVWWEGEEEGETKRLVFSDESTK